MTRITEQSETKGAGHTPGPWFDDEDLTDDGEICITAESRAGLVEICRVEVGFTGPVEVEQQANARLIAAAPTMAEYIRGRAASGDAEAARIMETFHGR